MRAETDAAIRAAEVAQKLSRSRDGADHQTSKGGIDLVTAADVACEDAIRRELLSAFPDYPVIGEERGGEPVGERPYWLVDPICGTRMFASGIPLYCTNIALVESGRVTVAAIAVGDGEEILYAERGQGSFRRTPHGERRVLAGDSSRTIYIDGKSEQVNEILRRARQTGQWYVCMFPSTISYAYVATGRLSALVHIGRPTAVRHGSVHSAAGCLAAAESGAIVTDLATGKEWTLATRAILVAATPEVHEELRKVLGI
jgi:myo-inositol-1(or 4)-monophosphatase